MSVDHGVYNSLESERPLFLDVVPGMTVIVQHGLQTGEKRDKDWWMGQVIHCGGAARDPSIHNCSRSLMWIQARSGGSTLIS